MTVAGCPAPGSFAVKVIAPYGLAKFEVFDTLIETLSPLAMSPLCEESVMPMPGVTVASHVTVCGP